jgi:hypothetical protein
MQGTPLRLLILFVCTTATVLILQTAFDASDHGKAERAVKNYSVGGPSTLGSWLEKQTPGGAWSSEITHGCRGIVQARYATPQVVYDFDYDVPGHMIHPGNETARAALEAFVKQAPVAVDGGVAPK